MAQQNTAPQGDTTPQQRTVPEEPIGLLDGVQAASRTELSEAPVPPLFMSRGGRVRLWLGTGGLLAALTAAYVVPGLSPAQPWQPGEDYVPFWNLVGREWLGQDSQAQQQAEEMRHVLELAQRATPANSGPLGVIPLPSSPEQPGVLDKPDADSIGQAKSMGQKPSLDIYPPYDEPAETGDVATTAIEFPERLDYYYARLTMTELRAPGAITRVGHWGDSALGNDGVTSAIRRRLQRRFGDAGHGFHVLARYNLGYLHQGVRFKDLGGWHKCQIIFKCEQDGLYGYGGVSAYSPGGGTSFWGTTKEGFGSAVSRFELWYLKQPQGGKFQVKVDGEVERVIDTEATESHSAWELIEVDDGPHEFEVRAIGGGTARGFGAVLEREGPGVVWDGLALIGSFTQRLDYQDPEHIAEQIRHRDNDMLVFLLGGNDVQRDKMDLYRTMQPYEDEYARVIKKFRAGKPEASCLIMSLTDHGERVGRHGIRTRKIVPKLVASQRKVAEQQGCAFFNTFEAMGGEGSIGRWYRSTPALAGADFAHPTSAGHEVIAELLVQALMQGYGRFRERMVGKPLPSAGTNSAANSNEQAED